MGNVLIIIEHVDKAPLSLFLEARAGGTQFEIAEDILYSVSGNNMNGYIITEWR